jgi:hypothetical protein
MLMSFKKILFIIIILFLFIDNQAFSQEKNSDFRDTVILMNGEKILTKVTDTTFYGVKMLTRKRKEVLLEGERIFSIKFPNGHEKIVYFQDSTIGNDLTLEEAQYYIRGEQDAAKLFRPAFPFIGGLIIGVASGSVGSLLSFIPPFAFSACMMIPKVKPKPSYVSDPSLLSQETYVMGYERVAKKKKAFQAMAGGVIGLAVGILGHSIYQSTK